MVYFSPMKTYILQVPDAATEAAVEAALAELLQQRRIVLESDTDALFSPLSEEEFAAELRRALASPKLSLDEARAYLKL